jgi:hypothetical protein
MVFLRSSIVFSCQIEAELRTQNAQEKSKLITLHVCMCISARIYSLGLNFTYSSESFTKQSAELGQIP